MFVNYATFEDGRWRVHASFGFPVVVKPRVVVFCLEKILMFAATRPLCRGRFVNPALEHLAAMREVLK